jgi:hypothetical protein
MKSKLMMLAVVLMALSIAVPVYAATCPVVSTVAALQALGSCTLGTGDFITFSNFVTTLPGSTSVTTVALGTAAGIPGSAGFIFAPSGGTSTPYTISYTATCNASCLINGASDSTGENPSGGSLYSFVAGGNSSGTVSGNFNTSFAGVSSAGNSGSYLSGGANQGITLDVNFVAAGTPATTPEPTSLILFGSGFLAVGLAARARRKARP